MEIRLFDKGEKLPMNLLLEANPSADLVYRYCSEGSCYTGSEYREITEVLVLYPLDLFSIEIKNIAVAEKSRGCGIGKNSFLSLCLKLAGLDSGK